MCPPDMSNVINGNCKVGSDKRAVRAWASFSIQKTQNHVRPSNVVLESYLLSFILSVIVIIYHVMDANQRLLQDRRQRLSRIETDWQTGR